MQNPHSSLICKRIGVRRPPTGPNSFILTYTFNENHPSLPREILDPPLASDDVLLTR